MSTDPLKEQGAASSSPRRMMGLAGCVRLAGCLWFAACGAAAPPPEDAEAHAEAETGSWSITAWGRHFEVFPEVGNLAAGEVTLAHVHVTRLDDFSPLAEGIVEVVLSSSSGEQVFRATSPDRPGVYTVPIQPSAEREYDLAFRLETLRVSEQIQGGRVRVGGPGRPGGLSVAPAPKGGSGGEPLAFLKEGQWRSDFATIWVRRGELARSVEGVARLRPPAGGEVLVSSPVAGVVHGARDWPFAGQAVRRGASLFTVAPLVAAGRSLASLEAEAAALGIEHNAGRQRLVRLEELLELEATSLKQVEELRHEVEVLESRHRAAMRDLEAATAARRGKPSGATVLEARFAGQVAEVVATPGATVAAGEALARLVRTDRVWIEVALPVAQAAELARLRGAAVGGLVLSEGRRASWRLEDVRLVAVAPEASATTGAVSVILEAAPVDGLALGSTLQAKILLPEARLGVVVPSSALVDDGGVTVVYLQLSGESFLREEVQVLERQGDQVLVEGLEPGQRLVSRGGAAIRRSSLMSSGGAHGHVH